MFNKKLQIDAGLPSVNMTVVEETLTSGILAVHLQKHDDASGVKNVDILMKTGKHNRYTILSFRFPT